MTSNYSLSVTDGRSDSFDQQHFNYLTDRFFSMCRRGLGTLLGFRA